MGLLDVSVDGGPPWVPFSMLNHVAYCPRRAWWIHCADVFEENVFTLEGRWIHRHVDRFRAQVVRERARQSRVFLWSEVYRIYGFVDILEEADGLLRPIEMKRGGPRVLQGTQVPWPNDAVQVVAQLLALRERTGQAADVGYVFYSRARHRVEVPLSTENVRQFSVSLETARQILNRTLEPVAQYTFRCQYCSLYPVCLPQETLRWQRSPAGRFTARELNPLDF